MYEYIEEWYNTYQVYKHAPQTAMLVRGYIRNHIKPSRLGKMEMKDAKAKDYQIFLKDLMMNGNRCRIESIKAFGSPLAKTTVNKIRQILVRVCDYAVKEGHIKANYAASTERISGRAKVTPIFTPKMQHDFLKEAKKTRFYLAFILGFFTGCRRGEILGLSWKNVNLMESVININQIVIAEGKHAVLKKNHAKTASSIRAIPIPKKIRNMLVSYKIKQERNATKTQHYYNPEGIVFTKVDGGLINPSNFSRCFKKICERLNFPDNMHFHCTRHTWATNMLQSGAAISDVQALGGWTSPDILLKIYSHSVKESYRKAMETMFRLMVAQGGLGDDVEFATIEKKGGNKNGSKNRKEQPKPLSARDEHSDIDDTVLQRSALEGDIHDKDN